MDIEKPIKEKYHLSNKILGQGTYGCVVKAVLKSNKKEERACKIIPKSRVKDINRLKLELEILKKLDHPNIVKLFEWQEDAKCFQLIMEILRGGELFDRIVDTGQLDEKLALEVFNSITRALNQCHKCNIVHRDLKPENFMTIEKDSWDIKLIDFGLAKNFKMNADVLTTKAGTPYYIAPEVLTGKYDHRCDIWSLGVILYIILCGQPPFHGDTDQEILVKVKRGLFNFDGDEWHNVSSEAKDVIRACLKVDPNDRPKAENLLEMPWFKLDFSSDKILARHETSFLLKQNKYSKFKKIIYAQLAMVSNEVELKTLKKVFEKMDTNGDGVLSQQEIAEGLKRNGQEDAAEIEQIFKGMDMDQNGQVEQTEFLAAMMDHQKWDSDDEKIKMAFKHLDFDDNGYIERNEIMKLVGCDNEEVVDYILELVDTNRDGKISYDEFRLLMVQESFNK